MFNKKKNSRCKYTKVICIVTHHCVSVRIHRTTGPGTMIRKNVHPLEAVPANWSRDPMKD